MTDLTWVLSSCVLILAVIALRAAFGKRMRVGLRYALWGLVLLRLLYPGTVLSSPVSVQSVAEQSEVVRNFEVLRGVDTIEYMDIDSSENSGYIVCPKREGMSMEWGTPERFERMQTTLKVRDVLEPIWFAGIAITSIVFLTSNLHFYAQLRKRRKPLDADCPLRVYSIENLSSSCLFGNTIYVAAETAADETKLRHVLAHELSHHRHGDHVWALLRCVALALHWYNPLVWWAAALSRQDSELCADAGALKRLGEDEGENYGATLIELSARRAPRASLLCTATTMTNGKKSLKERVTMIARRPRMTVAVVIAVMVIAAVAAGCTFAGAETEQHEFPMNGENISNLDTDRILSQISKVEKLEDSSVLCVNADNFAYFTSVFDWAEDGAIRYSYEKNRKTYSAQLRVFIEKSTYFITESQPWTEQGRIYKLKNYLDALKYLPQEEIRRLSPDADKYLVNCTDDGVPDDLDRVITYGAEGVAEQDGWTIHLMILPMHEEDGAYHGTGDEVIHLFYVEQSAKASTVGAESAESGGERLRYLFTQLSPSDVRLHYYADDGLRGSADGASALMAADYLAAFTEIEWTEADPMDEANRADDWHIELDGPGWRLISFQSSRRVLVEASGGELWLIARDIPDTQYSWISYETLEDWYLDARTAEQHRASGTPLTGEELAAWREELAVMRTVYDETWGGYHSSATMVSCFFSSHYADPRDLDLAEFLAYCPLSEPVEDEAEFDALNLDWEIEDENGVRSSMTLDRMPVPTHRYRVSRINDALIQYAGIMLDDLSTDWRNDERMLYVPEYDAFYNFTSDFGPGFFEPRYGERSGDIVTLWGDSAVLRLQLTDGGYHILSHLPSGAT